MNRRSEALHWFQQGYAAGVAAERTRRERGELVQQQAAIDRDLRQVIGILAEALLHDKEAAAVRGARKAAARRASER